MTGRACGKPWPAAAPVTRSWSPNSTGWPARCPTRGPSPEDLTKRKVRLNLGASVYDPTDPVRRVLFNVLAMVAEFEADLIRSRTREGIRVAKAKGHLRGKQPKLNPGQEGHLVELLRSGECSVAELGR